MKMSRTIGTGIAVISLALCSLFGNAEAAPRPTLQSGKSVMRLGTPNQNAAPRGVGIVPCDPLDILVSENLDMVTVTPGNSVNCFSGSGTPEHRYGRSHDLSLGATAGLAVEITCVHFTMAQNSVAGTWTVNIYQDIDGIVGPLPDGSDLFLLETGSFIGGVVAAPITVSVPMPAAVEYAPDVTLFIEIVIPESFPGTHEIGSNAGGELSPTWLRTSNGECGIGSWVNPALLGFPNMHLLEAIEVREAVIPDPCDSALPNCAADVDNDGVVAVSDVLAVIGNWGVCGDGTFRPVGDVAPLPNGDCCVNVSDLLAVIADFGVECVGSGITFGINEIRIDHVGSDTDEFVELIGTPGQILDGYSYIVIGDGAGGSGVIEALVDLTGLEIGLDGLLSLGEASMTIAIPDVIVPNLNFENSDNVTHMLVGGLTALLNDDLDVDNDGVLDGVFWTELVDAIGIVEDPVGGDLIYAVFEFGPSGDFPPAHVFRCPDGGDWHMGVFASQAMDTPGDPNMCDVPDLDGDGIFDLVDNCFLPNPDQADCNANGIGDVCDIDAGTSLDCNGNGIPDECEPDCDGNGIPDECDIAGGASDCDGNGILDSCEPDCNANGIADACDISSGASTDLNGNGVPDECEVGTLAYTSFEEPTLGSQYADTGDPAFDHQLLNNAGQADVGWVAVGAEMGFTAWYVNTRGSVGLTDGDWVGTQDFVGTVGAYTDGVQGYEMSDCDGLMRVDFDTVAGAGTWNVSLDLYIQSTGWEADDVIKVDVVVDGGAVITILDTTGQDIDNLAIEGAWLTYVQDLSTFTTATLRVSLDSNSGFEAIYIDNVVFSSNAIVDTDGDGIPDVSDNCPLPNPDQLDCNVNGIGDVCDIADGTSLDCNLNGIPDDCEADCNTNGIPDDCDIANGTSIDADGNGIPDECEVVSNSMVITGVVDGPLGGGTPKVVEVYVISNIADLSLFGLGSANNGGGSDGQEFTFDAVAATAGDFIYIASEDVNFLAFFGFAPDYVSSVAFINGDDAIELFENGNVIDTFGDINTDGNGEPWEYLDGWAYRNDTTGPDGVSFMLGSWSFSGVGALTGETTNGTAAIPFPLGFYIP